MPQHHLHTEIEIAAPPAVVWQVLVDLERYADWNPFVVESTGTVARGARLTNRMQPPGGRAVTFRPTVTDLVDGRAFEWLGHLGLRGLFDGRHRFELTPTPSGGTHLAHSEHFTGVLVPLMGRSLYTRTAEGFNAMNAALKDRAEARARASN